MPNGMCSACSTNEYTAYRPRDIQPTSIFQNDTCVIGEEKTVERVKRHTNAVYPRILSGAWYAERITHRDASHIGVR